jgi:hypothetical protein
MEIIHKTKKVLRLIDEQTPVYVVDGREFIDEKTALTFERRSKVRFVELKGISQIGISDLTNCKEDIHDLDIRVEGDEVYPCIIGVEKDRDSAYKIDLSDIDELINDLQVFRSEVYQFIFKKGRD